MEPIQRQQGGAGDSGLPYLAPSWKKKTFEEIYEEEDQDLDDPYSDYFGVYARAKESHSVLTLMDSYVSDALRGSIVGKVAPLSQFTYLGVPVVIPPVTVADSPAPLAIPAATVVPVTRIVEDVGEVLQECDAVRVVFANEPEPAKFDPLPAQGECFITEEGPYTNVMATPFEFFSALAECPVPSGCSMQRTIQGDRLVLTFIRGRKPCVLYLEREDLFTGGCIGFLDFLARAGFRFGGLQDQFLTLFTTLISAHYLVVNTGVGRYSAKYAAQCGVAPVFRKHVGGLGRYVTAFPGFLQNSAFDSVSDAIVKFVRALDLGPYMIEHAYRLVHPTRCPQRVVYARLPPQRSPLKVSHLPRVLRYVIGAVSAMAAPDRTVLAVMGRGQSDFELIAWLAYQLGIPVVANDRISHGTVLLVCHDDFMGQVASDPVPIRNLRRLRGIQLVGEPVWPAPLPEVSVSPGSGIYVRFRFIGRQLLSTWKVLVSNDGGVLSSAGGEECRSVPVEARILASVPYVLSQCVAPKSWSFYVRLGGHVYADCFYTEQLPDFGEPSPGEDIPIAMARPFTAFVLIGLDSA